MLTREQEIELYTAIDTPLWLAEIHSYKEDPIGFLNKFRGKWSFLDADLKMYLQSNPGLLKDYLALCQRLVNVHDKVVLIKENEAYLVFSTDHGSPRWVEKFENPIEAAIKWLNYRYMN